MNSPDTVIVRRRWNEPATAEIAVASLWELHFRNDAGGVCGALPRSFLCAHLWCDHLPSGASLGHVCREPSAPHELVVCILPHDNPQLLYEQLHARARARS